MNTKRTTTQTTQSIQSSFAPIDILSKYWQLVVALIAIIVGWTLFESRLNVATVEIKELKARIEKQEDVVTEYQKETLQRLSSIEAKVDFLVKSSSTQSKAKSPTIENKVTTNVRVTPTPVVITQKVEEKEEPAQPFNDDNDKLEKYIEFQNNGGGTYLEFLLTYNK